MPYDVAFRHQQALDPSALVTIGASLHAITRAIDDCRNAGIAFETDPAVILPGIASEILRPRLWTMNSSPS